MSNLTVLDQDLPDFLQTAGVSALTKQLAGKTGVKRIVPKKASSARLSAKKKWAKSKAT